jgi:alpha-galactosidase
MVVVVTAEDAVVQRYWGSRLDDGSLDAFVGQHRDRWNSSFERPADIDEHLPVRGGPRWGLAAVQAWSSEGGLSLRPEFDGAESAGGELRLHLVDRIAGLSTTLHYRVTAEDDAVDRWATLSNRRADGALRLVRSDSGSWPLPDLTDYRVSTAHGYWGGEGQLERCALPHGEYRIGSRQGVTGHASAPWMMIDDGSATETTGDVWSVSLRWSGSWHITAQRRPEGSVAIMAGWTQDGVDVVLAPGEQVVTPMATGVFTPRGLGGASRAWHQVIRQRILPNSATVRPIVYNSWEATGFDIDLDVQLALADEAAAIGVELFVMDDGWFQGRRNEAAGLGDWRADSARFPDGLQPLVDRVHGLGMRFGLWVEPEMVNVDSDLHRAHPDWVQQSPGREPHEIRSQLILDVGLPAVQDHIVATLDRLVQDNGIDFLKWDMNRPFTDAGRPGDPAASHSSWRTHTEGVYSMIDRLRDLHPGLMIEGCASGGARIDLGILSRVEQVWTSDNTDALDRQSIQHGHSQLYPAISMGAWVTEAQNVLTGRVVPLEYRFHVAMAGDLGIGADLRRWSDEERATARQLIERYKSVRSTIQHGDQYRLGGVPGVEQSAIQYVDAAAVVVLAYDPHRSLSAAPRRIRLLGLDPDQVYEDEVTGERRSGAFLMGHGISANRGENHRGWDNTRFSNRDYVSSITVLRPARRGSGTDR